MFLFFFFNDTATTEIYTLSLHDALPISSRRAPPARAAARPGQARSDAPSHAAGTAAPVRLRAAAASRAGCRRTRNGDRKSTRLNSSHANISYAVFCLKKKKKTR